MDRARSSSPRRKDHPSEPKYSDSRASRSDRRSSRDRAHDKERGERRDRHRSRSPGSRRSEHSSRRHRDGNGHRDKDRDSRRSRRRSTSRDRDRRSRHIEDEAPVRSRGPLPSQQDSFALTRTDGEAVEKPKEKANYGNSGLLAAASNSVAQADGSTITLKYHEPAEARKPSPRDEWKLFVFKGTEPVDTVDLSHRSCWLIGREAAVVDLLAEHPSISKQHAVIQFRYTEKRNEFGDKIGKVKPYLIDLDSTKGTVLNDGKVSSSRYLELRDKDVLLFGDSMREYVIMLAPRA